jgi:hypothetical protein
MPYDKLSIINDELAKTGNNLVTVEDDGSDEWNVCSPSFDNAVDLTIERHDWNFGTRISVLSRVAASPDDLYQDAYPMPSGSLALVWVRLNDQTVDYKIIGNQICLTAHGLTPTAKYVIDPGAANWPPIFAAIIRLHVRAGIYRGIEEDAASADKEEEKAELMLQEARTRIDQESPKRAVFNSRAITARRVRRPWVNSPDDWGGTGVPD